MPADAHAQRVEQPLGFPEEDELALVLGVLAAKRKEAAKQRFTIANARC